MKHASEMLDRIDAAWDDLYNDWFEESKMAIAIKAEDVECDLCGLIGTDVAPVAYSVLHAQHRHFAPAGCKDAVMQLKMMHSVALVDLRDERRAYELMLADWEANALETPHRDASGKKRFLLTVWLEGFTWEDAITNELEQKR